MSEIEANPADTIKLATRIKILIAALLITPLALLVGYSVAMGNAIRVAMIIFPYTSISLDFTDNRAIAIILGIFQIPVYGLLLVISQKRNIMLRVGMGIIIIHSIAVLLCFSNISEFLTFLHSAF